VENYALVAREQRFSQELHCAMLVRPKRKRLKRRMAE
jgi:hypothetical protein